MLAGLWGVNFAMSEENRKIEKEKELGTAYLLWFFLGFFGGHRFYLKRKGSAITMLVIMVLFLLTAGARIDNFGLIVIIIVWWVIDGFLITGILKDYNKNLIECIFLRDNADEEEDKKNSSKTIAEANVYSDEKSMWDVSSDSTDERNQTTVSPDTIALMNFDARKKNTIIAYLLWWFLGFLGIHRFYLKKTGSAIFMLILCLGSFSWIVISALNAFNANPRFYDYDIAQAVTFGSIAILGLIAFSIWWIIDIFLIAGMVKEYNQELIKKIKNGDRDE